MKAVDWVLGFAFAFGMALAGADFEGWPWNVPVGLALLALPAVFYSRRNREPER